MGLGKTAATLAALEPRHLPVLVVAPKRVAESVWPAETKLWRPDLTVSVATGSPAARATALRADADLVVLGRDNLRDALTVKRDRPFQTVVLDELSGFRSRSSVRWKAARKLIQNRDHPVPHVWGLTGTPSPNGLMDLWAQIFLLDGGERLGKTLGGFRSRYFFPGRRLPTGVIIEWIPHADAADAIHRKLDDLCLSMGTEGRVDLPPITENHIEVELPPKVRAAYRDMKRSLVADLSLTGLGTEIHSAANAAVLTSKLSQISAGFMYVDDADVRGPAFTRLHAEKARAVVEVVEGTGSPVLVFYRYRAEAALLRETLAKAGVDAYDVKEAGVIADWNRGRVPVMLAHPASAGHGLNLQHGGHTIVWTTLDWDLELWQQANKRLARQGQKHPVVIHCVMARKTIDHVIRAALDDKNLVQTALLDHLDSPL